jgi:hypothetical protein
VTAHIPDDDTCALCGLPLEVHFLFDEITGQHHHPDPILPGTAVPAPA